MRRGAPLAPNTPDQIREMAAAGVELGAHTRRHVDLGAVRDETQLHEEIAGSKRDLESITGRPVRYFAFPYGLHANLSEAAFRMAFAAGYWGVCSAYGGYNDIRILSPAMQAFLEKLAYNLGAGKSLADLQTKGTSGYNELALVYNPDVKSNSGNSYPGTPGHFDEFSCAP